MRALRLCFVVVVLAGLAVLGLGPAADASTASKCASGLNELRTGHLLKAAAIYRKVPASAACARHGLAAASALLLAERLSSVGLDGAANAQIELALKAEPTLSVPGNVMPGTLGQAGIRLAEALDRAGFHDQAVQILLRVIRNDPGIQLSATIKGILDPPLYVKFWDFATSKNGAIVWSILVFLFLIFYAVWRSRLHFQPFTGSGDDEASASSAEVLRSRVRAELHRLVEETSSATDGRRIRLDQAGPYEQVYDIGKVADGLPGIWKFLAGATGQLTQVFGSRSRLVTGVLLPGTAVAIGIETVNGRVEDIEVIEHAKLAFPDPDKDSLGQLALPAAAWILLAHYDHITLGGTTNWTSWVSFAAGYAWQQQGDIDQAMTLYESACEDPTNTAAAVNLAALQQLKEAQRTGDAIARPPSMQRLTALVDTVDPKDLQWYRARYLLSSAQPDVDNARRLAIDLSLRLNRLRGTPNVVPWEFLHYGQAAALTLLARLVIPRASQLEDMVLNQDEVFGTDGAVPDFTETNLEAQLARMRATGPAKGDPERLVEFATRRVRRLDDRAKYNLFRYHRIRATICAAAHFRYRQALADPSIAGLRSRQAFEWRNRVYLWLPLLAKQYDLEVEQAQEFEAQVEQAGDPVLVGHLKADIRRLPGYVIEESASRDGGEGDLRTTKAPPMRPPPDEERPPEQQERPPDAPVPRPPEGTAVTETPELEGRPRRELPPPDPTETEEGQGERLSPDDPSPPPSVDPVAGGAATVGSGDGYRREARSNPFAATRRPNRFLKAIRRIFGIGPIER